MHQETGVTIPPSTFPDIAERDKKAKRRPLKERLWRARYDYLMLLPGLALILIFNYGPMYGVLIAFKDYKITRGVWGSQWVGLQHFRDLFANPAATTAIRNSVEISLLRIVFGTPAPIILALLINEIKDGAFKRFVQSASYLPHFISWIVIASMVGALLSPRSGAGRC